MDATEAKKLIGKMIRANRLHRSLAEKRNREADIHRNQQHILLYLSKSETPPSQKELAAVFEVTPAAIAMSLKKMEQKGLIERVPSPDDTRVNLITVSDKGKAIMESSRRFFEQTDLAMIEGLTREEFEVISGALDKFIDNLLRIGAQDECPPYIKNSMKGNDK